MSSRWIVVSAVAVALGACNDPLCESDPLPTDAARDVTLEVHMRNAEGRPVFVQDSSGTILREAETDVDGSYVFDEVPGDATITVDLGERGEGGRGPILVSYAGVVSGDALVLSPREDPVENGTATITVRFPRLEDPRVAYYHLDLGHNCGTIPQIAQDGSPSFEVIVQARCVGVAGVASVVAEDAQGRFVGVTTAAIDVANGDQATVDAAPWQTGTARLTLSGQFDEDVQVLVSARIAGRARASYQSNRIGGGSVITVPDAPGLFDTVGIILAEGGNSSRAYQVELRDPEDFTIAVDDLLPVIEDLEIEGAATGAPRVAWKYGGPARAAFAYYSVDEPPFSRVAIRTDGGCHVAFPSLPPGYETMLPDAEEDFVTRAGVSLIDGELDSAFVRTRIGPLGSYPEDIAVVSTDASENVVIRQAPDPS